MHQKKQQIIALVSNTAWSLYNFRLGLIRSLQDRGFKVVAIAPADDYSGQLIDEGCLFEPLPLDNYGSKPLEDIRSFRALVDIYRKHRPCFIFHYTIKPNIYGSLAAGWLRIPSVAVVTGLGFLFTNRSWKTVLAGMLYWLAFQRAKQVWFLNESDGAVMVENKILPEKKTGYLPSEGIDIDHFSQQHYGLLSSGRFRFLFAGRFIAEKGIRDYVTAARILRKKGYDAEFQLLGFFENDNPHAIRPDEVMEWESKGLVSFLGAAKDVRPHLERTDCVVLPTYYREGVPRILLEAASMQIPIVATDNVGCREVVEDGLNGFLCRRKDPHHLAQCMEKMINRSLEERKRFGKEGRKRVCAIFDERIAIQKYLKTLKEAGVLTERARRSRKGRIL